nr:acyl-CoA dehydrogenase family protein [Kineosporia babensis]
MEQFRLRAREWLAANLPKASTEGEFDWDRGRQLQRQLYEGGFAGLCYPREYGGQGLTPQHQRVFNEEALDYEMPVRLNFPTLTICGPTLLDTGSEEQKKEFLPAAIAGELLFCQFLSEPSGGSDLAGVLTRAERTADGWLLNGAKTWSSSADTADWAMVLARTDWDVPKHQGLTMFLMRIRQPGVQVNPIQMLNGSHEFCEEFFDDVRLPSSAVLGEVNGGWAVATRLLYHERAAVGGASPFVSGVRQGQMTRDGTLTDLVRESGQADSERARDLLARSEVLHLVHSALAEDLTQRLVDGELPDAAMSYIRLFHAEAQQAEIDCGLELAGPAGVTDSGSWALRYLGRQGLSLGGGSTEMARNVIAERVLGMPREASADKGVPFRQVRQGPTS